MSAWLANYNGSGESRAALWGKSPHRWWDFGDYRVRARERPTACNFAQVSWRTWRGVAAVACAMVASAGPAWADPVDPAGPDVQPVAAAEATPPPIDDGKVISSPPETAKTLDGWTMTIGGEDETQRVIAPLTTAVSSREYEVGGTFTGSLKDPSGAPAPAKGVLEVGYQIGCGIDMTTGTGVVLGGDRKSVV